MIVILFNFRFKYSHQIQKAAKNTNEAISLRYTYEQFRKCVMMHDEAIQLVLIKKNNRC